MLLMLVSMKTGIQKAIEAAGGVTALARHLGIDHNAIRRWHSVPDHWIIKIEHLTMIPREELRPDLYLAPRPKKHA
jgi:DNA-binding transcriptional regulator YdaS (Cro superfamily)